MRVINMVPEVMVDVSNSSVIITILSLFYNIVFLRLNLKKKT